MIEIKVRKVERYIVTRYTENESGASSEQLGEFPNDIMADDVAGAMYERANSAGMVVSVEYSDGATMNSAKDGSC